MSKKYQNEDRITFFEKIKRNISDFFYDIKVKIHQKRTAGKEAVVKIQASKNKGEIVFCISILVFPLIQWAFFFFALNGANILMAFKQYNITTKTFEYLPFNSCLKNFGNVLSDIFSGADGGWQWATDMDGKNIACLASWKNHLPSASANPVSTSSWAIPCNEPR